MRNFYGKEWYCTDKAVGSHRKSLVFEGGGAALPPALSETSRGAQFATEGLASQEFSYSRRGAGASPRVQRCKRSLERSDPRCAMCVGRLGGAHTKQCMHNVGHTKRLECVHRQPFPHTPHTSHRFPQHTPTVLHAGASPAPPSNIKTPAGVADHLVCAPQTRCKKLAHVTCFAQRMACVRPSWVQPPGPPEITQLLKWLQAGFCVHHVLHALPCVCTANPSHTPCTPRLASLDAGASLRTPCITRLLRCLHATFRVHHLVYAPACICIAKPFHTHCTPRLVALWKWLASLNAGANPPARIRKNSRGGYGQPCVCTALCVQHQPFRGTLRTSARFAQSGGETPSPPSKIRLLRWLHTALCVSCHSFPQKFLTLHDSLN